VKLLFDCTPEVMYPLAKEGFSGGSQVYIRAITKGLAARGHQVHIIANDLDDDEQRGPNEWWWPASNHPHKADVAVMQMHAVANPQYTAPKLVLMTSCIDPQLGPNNEAAKWIDAVPCFSEVHKTLLCQTRPIAPEKCHVTGLGVDLHDYVSHWVGQKDAPALPHIWRGVKASVPGRMLYANDPARGPFHVLDVFDEVKKQVPNASLHVAYDFDTQFGWRAWEHSQMAQLLWDCKRRIAETPGVVNLGALTREQIIREELQCQVHCYPSDPPGVGTQTHGLTQAECAAAGAALVLSDIEAFPECFGTGAEILPRIGTYVPEIERRIDAADYAAVVVELMNDPEKMAEASRKARAMAETMTWTSVIDKWEVMLEGLRA